MAADQPGQRDSQALPPFLPHSAERTLRLFLERNGPVEVAVFRRRRGEPKAVAVFDQVPPALDWLAGYTKRTPAEVGSVYLTLNRLTPAYVAAAGLGMTHDPAVRRARRADFARRTHLLLDLDVVRRADSYASAPQLLECWRRAQFVREHLAGYGFPAPAVGCSGNGMHLLLGVDLPNDPQADQLAKAFLQAVSARFSEELVAVDQAVFDTPRISKLMGTQVHRPDPQATVDSVPSGWIELPELLTVPRELLEEFVQENQDHGTVAGPGRGAATAPPHGAGTEGNHPAHGDADVQPADPDRPDADRVRAALAFLMPDDYWPWVRVGMALSDWSQGNHEGLQMWDAWSQGTSRSNYTPGACASKWRTFTGSGERVTIRSLLKQAVEAGWDARQPVKPLGIFRRTEPAADPASPACPPTDRPTTEVLPAQEDPFADPPDLLEAQVEEVEDLRVEWLPDPIRGYAADTAERLQVPVCFVAVPLLCCLGITLGRGLAIAPLFNDSSHLVYSNVWGVVVAPPGAKKSGCLAAGTRFLRTFEEKWERDWSILNTNHRAALVLHQARHKRSEQKLADAVRKGGGAVEAQQVAIAEPKAPICPRIMTSDTTPERLLGLARENPRGMAIVRDELAGLLLQLGQPRYANLRQLLLEGASGRGEARVDRMTRDSEVVRGLCLSVLGSAQPDTLRRLLVDTTSHRSAGRDGLLPRFGLVAYAPMKPTFELIDRPPNDFAFQRAEEAFKRCRDLKTDVFGALTKDADTPYVHFHPLAQESFNDWLIKLEIKLRTPGLPEQLGDLLAKHRALVPALCLLDHVVSCPGGVVCHEHLDRAIRIAATMAAHSRKLYVMCGTASRHESALVLARRVQEGALGASFTLPEVVRKGWGGLSELTAVEGAVAYLEQRRWVRAAPNPKSARGGRPTTRWEVHPDIVAGHDGRRRVA